MQLTKGTFQQRVFTRLTGTIRVDGEEHEIAKVDALRYKTIEESSGFVPAPQNPQSQQTRCIP